MTSRKLGRRVSDAMAQVHKAFERGRRGVGQKKPKFMLRHFSMIPKLKDFLGFFNLVVKF